MTGGLERNTLTDKENREGERNLRYTKPDTELQLTATSKSSHKKKVAKMPGILFCLKNVWSGQEKSKFYDTLKVGQPGTHKKI